MIALPRALPACSLWSQGIIQRHPACSISYQAARRQPRIRHRAKKDEATGSFEAGTSSLGHGYLLVASLGSLWWLAKPSEVRGLLLVGAYPVFSGLPCPWPNFVLNVVERVAYPLLDVALLFLRSIFLDLSLVI